MYVDHTGAISDSLVFKSYSVHSQQGTFILETFKTKTSFSPLFSGDVTETVPTQRVTEPSSALYVVCGFVGVAQFTVQSCRELWPIRQIL